MVAPWFRTTDLTRWGAANSGGNFSATQFDENTWYFKTHIAALEALPLGVNIDFITVTGDQMTITMTDHTNFGPFTLPTATFNFRGDWLDLTPYTKWDVITANGGLYVVLFNHTSASVFDPGANDGMGHNYYGLLLAAPGSSLPTGGAIGQVLTKSTSADYAVTWSWKLPTGGSANQLLMKNSGSNQDADWRTSPFVWAPPASPSGSPGQVLSTVDGTASNTEWIDAGGGGSGGISAPPSSPAGNDGQVPATVDGTPTSMEWIDVIYAPPSSPAGQAGQAFITEDGSNLHTGYANIIAPLDLSPTLRDNSEVYYDHGATTWTIRSPQQVDYGSVPATNIAANPLLWPFITFIPAGDVTIDNTAHAGKLGMTKTIEITTSGSTSYNISFIGGGWTTQGTLATGTVGGKKWILHFTADSVGGLHELSRIGPI